MNRSLIANHATEESFLTGDLSCVSLHAVVAAGTAAEGQGK